MKTKHLPLLVGLSILFHLSWLFRGRFAPYLFSTTEVAADHPEIFLDDHPYVNLWNVGEQRWKAWQEKQRELPPFPKPVYCADEPLEYMRFPDEAPRFPGCENQMISLAEKKSCADQRLLSFIFKNLQLPPEAGQSSIWCN